MVRYISFLITVFCLRDHVRMQIRSKDTIREWIHLTQAEMVVTAVVVHQVMFLEKLRSSKSCKSITDVSNAVSSCVYLQQISRLLTNHTM